ncbi:hypothetical protein FB446DRAFT_508371 [Lentinula raphanica]|nr:hypothetical protein FB446DRAFT_508371 [Lentinula raphanica]
MSLIDIHVWMLTRGIDVYRQLFPMLRLQQQIRTMVAAKTYNPAFTFEEILLPMSMPTRRTRSTRTSFRVRLQAVAAPVPLPTTSSVRTRRLRSVLQAETGVYLVGKLWRKRWRACLYRVVLLNHARFHKMMLSESGLLSRCYIVYHSANRPPGTDFARTSGASGEESKNSARESRCLLDPYVALSPLSVPRSLWSIVGSG